MTPRTMPPKLPVTPQASPAGGCVALAAFAVVIAIVFTLGWNYGITEIIESLGGPDGNINVLVGFLSVLAVRAIYTKA